MFPFYNQPSIPYYQPGINQNHYMYFNQQGYQFNPLLNPMVQYPQPIFMNYSHYQQSTKPVLSPSETILISQNSTQTRKYFSCNCINTDCRKQYCICFKNGETCGAKCGCSNCRNKEQHDRNVPLQKKRNVSCNCKKSQCAKKYCECYANGIQCGESCHCSQCKNC